MLKNMFSMLSKTNKSNKQNILINTLKFNTSSKRHQTYFDINIDWLKNLIISPRLTFTQFLAIINIGLFLYANFRYNKRKKGLALSGVSYSKESMRSREYIPLFASLLGSRRIDDVLLDTGILLTLGHTLEKLHGTPFIFKLWIYTFYIGILSSIWWVSSNHSKRYRYLVHDPFKTNYEKEQPVGYRFMSSHGFTMSIIYFYLMRNRNLRLLVIPVIAADLAIWGPYYSSGILTGLASALIL
jgi:hypothetical protein